MYNATDPCKGEAGALLWWKDILETTKMYFSYLSLESFASHLLGVLELPIISNILHIGIYIYIYINNNDIAVSTNFHLKILYTFYNFWFCIKNL